MKVLWYSHVSMKQDVNGKFFYPGGNWISSLKKLFLHDENIELAIVFWGDNDLVFKDDSGTTYYQLHKNNNSKLIKYFNNWRHEIGSKQQLEKLVFPIKDFSPDIIHVFGTETMFGKITKYTKVPVVIHLQGIINPYLNAWFFPGFKGISLFKSLNPVFLAKGVGLFHDYYRFEKMALRELEIFKACSNFIGRTHWDKAITKLYAPHANYYHCDEIIRNGFYKAKWEMPKNTKFILTSTINENIYKGLDLILKTAVLLKQNANFDFEWNIYGIRPNSEYAKFIEHLIGEKFYDNNVILKGITLEEELLQALLNSNIFVHASYIDNSPNSICEAQLIGLPVISTNVGGISTLIQDGIDGFLVPSNEPHILASKVIELINVPKNLMIISSNAISVAEKRHNKSIVKDNLLSIYKIAISKCIESK
ncbi:glycosyltransferase [Flavobacterium maritimum]|uniref:glycosyltransferase n=1 Tax=Flavobacterium maritimum TaxID=3149042 RepID=UPI0032B33F31